MAAGLPVLIKGAPGVGKSDIVSQVADELNMDLVISHPVVSDPTDYKGLPLSVNGAWAAVLDVLRELAFTAATTKNFGLKEMFKAIKAPLETIDDTGVKAEFVPFGELNQLINAKKPTIAFLDDLGQAPACVQAAAMQLILARRVNGHHISDNVVFVAATNRRQDRAGVTGILEPVKSRFATIYELVQDESDWVEWAFKNNMPGKLIAFVHFRPGILNDFKPTADITNGPCGRTIANAGKLLNAGVEDIASLSGAFGEGTAIEATGFFRYWQELPNLTALINDPDSFIDDIPDEPAALYAVVTGLVEKADSNNIGRIFKYSSHLPKDFDILLGRDCIRKDKKIQNTKAFVKWAVKNKDILAA
jgi:hypothetical protein